MFGYKLPPTNSNPKMPLVNTIKGKHCRYCSKSNVCKYREVAMEEIERLVEESKKKELPLSFNISCAEFQHEINGVRGEIG